MQEVVESSPAPASSASAPHVISVWRTLFEEHVEFSVSDGALKRTLLSAAPPEGDGDQSYRRAPGLFELRGHLLDYEAAVAKSGGSDSAEIREAETRLRNALHQQMHGARRSALCFSGGGIRSATFGLGVLQGLAKWSAEEDGKPLLLGEVDYLSTVSGGGYLGAWFSAWAAREATGAAGVIQELSRRQESLFEPEPGPLRHLRMYSNYLSPRLGMLSGDGWALAATVARNMFLNWLVLLPMVAALLLLPELSYRLVSLAPSVISPAVLWSLVGTAFIAGASATAYVGMDLPSAGNARNRHVWYLWGCLAPLTLAAVELSTFWAWLPAGHSAEWWDLVGLGKHGLEWWHFAGFGALTHGGGMSAGILFARFRYGHPPTHKGLIAAAVAFLTGVLAGSAAFGLTQLVALRADGSVSNVRLYVCCAFPLVLGLFMLAATLLVGGSSYITEDEDREWWSRAGGWFLLVAVAWPVFSALVIYASDAINWLDLRLTSALTGGAGITGWMASRFGASSKTPAGRRDESPQSASGTGDAGAAAKKGLDIREYGSRLLLPAFIALLSIVLAAANSGLLSALTRTMPSAYTVLPVLELFVIYVVACLFASYFINVNKFSLHGMYRQRLIRAYLGASNPKRNPHPFTGFDENDNLSMAKLSASKPLHVVNMALNLVAGQNLAWQQRKAASFTSTRLHTGSCRLGYQRSDTYGGAFKEAKTPISLGTATTISGAAASPNMGYNSSALLTLVMTLFNARLGWWLGNPKETPDVWKRPGPRWGLRPFIDEALGLTTDTNAWVYLSDGGHFENLGLYEMILRRCHSIILVDASADSKFTYEDLGNAVRKVRIDLGVPIELDTEAMLTSPPADREGKRLHYTTARIVYSAIDAPLQNGKRAEDGSLIYIKPCLTGDEPPDVAQYHSTDSSFPHQSTAEQFFSEAQFESYRRLGLHSIDAICAEWPFPDAPLKRLSLDGFVERAEGYLKGAKAKSAAAD